MNNSHDEFQDYLKKFRNHFRNNPEKLYSVKFFVSKYGIEYARARLMLNRLRSQGFISRFYLSAWQSCRAWGVPQHIFSLYVFKKIQGGLNGRNC